MIKFSNCNLYMYISFLGTNHGNYLMKLIFSILGPMIGLVVIGGILFCLLTHRTRRKRPTASRRNKLIIDSEIEPSILHFSFSSPTSSATYHPHELRATAAGDSTLKVRSINSFCL